MSTADILKISFNYFYSLCTTWYTCESSEALSWEEWVHCDIGVLQDSML